MPFRPLSKASNNQGSKQFPCNANKQCHFCKNKGHIQSECRKKKWAEANKIKPKSDNYQNNKSYNIDSNSKYNTSPQSSRGNVDNKTFIRCNYCNIKGHGIAECRHRQKEEYDNAGSGTIWCRYCKCAGHTIDVCKKRINKEQAGGDKFLGNRGYIRLHSKSKEVL